MKYLSQIIQITQAALESWILKENVLAFLIAI
jgi:hypothetical protein